MSLAEYPIADPVIDAILTGLAERFPGCLYGWETSADLHYDVGFVDLPARRSIGRPARTWRSARARLRSGS